MEKNKTQVILISQLKSRIHFAKQNLKNLQHNLKIITAKDITSALHHLDKKNTFSLMVIMVGYTYFDSFDDAYIHKFIKINNCEDLNLKLLIIQPLESKSLKEINTTTLKYIETHSLEFKNIDVLGLFDSDYKGALNITPFK